MKTLKVTALMTILGGFFFLLSHFTAEATLKHKKDTGKKCLFCHTRIPEPEEADPQLNEEGKKFKEKGYLLTEEQQTLP